MSVAKPAAESEVGGTPLPPGWAAPAHQPGSFNLTTTTFADRAHEGLARPFQRQAIANATDHTIVALHNKFEHVDHDALRETARCIRAHAIANLPDYLEQWIDNAERRGITVHFAADEAEARRTVAAICQREQIESVVKSKSMASEEVALNSALEGIGVSVFETDLGEFVVQAMGDRPSHVIAPILHRTRAEVREQFSRMAGEQLPDDPAALTAFARAGLRHAFLSADGGITGGNFLIAETGEVALVTNEGNGRLTTSLPRVHIALVGIEKLVPCPVSRSPPTSPLPVARALVGSRTGPSRCTSSCSTAAVVRCSAASSRRRCTAFAAAPARTSAPSIGRSVGMPTAGSTGDRLGQS